MDSGISYHRKHGLRLFGSLLEEATQIDLHHFCTVCEESKPCLCPLYQTPPSTSNVIKDVACQQRQDQRPVFVHFSTGETNRFRSTKRIGGGGEREREEENKQKIHTLVAAREKKRERQQSGRINIFLVVYTLFSTALKGN